MRLLKPVFSLSSRYCRPYISGWTISVCKTMSRIVLHCIVTTKGRPNPLASIPHKFVTPAGNLRDTKKKERFLCRKIPAISFSHQNNWFCCPGDQFFLHQPINVGHLIENITLSLIFDENCANKPFE